MTLNSHQQEEFQKKKSVRVQYQMEDRVRMRVTAQYQKGTMSASIKLIGIRVPTLKDLGLFNTFEKLSLYTEGLVLISGPYNSGKTTLASAIVEEINNTRSANIVTIEDPIEYVFINHKSIIQQRQIGRDVNSFVEGVKQCRNEDVDVVVISENQEPEIIRHIFALAGSGKLVIYLREDLSAIQSLERLFRKFNTAEIEGAYKTLADIFCAAVSLRLIPKATTGMIAAYDLLFSNRSVSSLIAEGKIRQLISIMQTSPEAGMTTLDQHLYSLIHKEIIRPEVGLSQAVDKENFAVKLRR